MRGCGRTGLAAVMLSACARNASPPDAGAPAPIAAHDVVVVQDRGPVGAVRNGLVESTTETHTTRPAQRTFSEAMVAQLRAPAGFRINVFAQGLDEPRVMVNAPGGGVFVSERKAGRVTLLRDNNRDGRAESRQVVVSGLGEGRLGVHGLAVWHSELWMVTDRKIYVSLLPGDGTVGAPSLRATDLPSAGQHPNRTFGVAPDGALLLSLGSTCNACPPEPEEATIVRVTSDGRTRAPFASGLRNTIAFAWNPVSHQLWGFDHGTDFLGDERPREELNAISAGQNYGWPHCWNDRQVDPNAPHEPPTGTRAEFCARSIPPTLTYAAHAAPMQMVYYTGTRFPEAYRNDAFVSLHGSWNRRTPVGYEVVRVRHNDQGVPTSIEPFVSGWLIEEGRAQFGRPMGLVVLPDGSLLIGDDAQGVIYRVAFTGSGAAP